MKLKLLLSAAAAVCLALPAAAEPPTNGTGAGGEGQHGQGQGPHGPGQGTGHTGGAGVPAGGATAGRGAVGAAVQTPGPAIQKPQPGRGFIDQYGTPGGVAGHGTPGGGVGQGPLVNQAPVQSHGPGGRPPQPGRTPPKTPALGGWNQAVRGTARLQAGQQWRQAHRGWDQSAPWRANRNWWRGNAAFRLFAGPRVGFFFIPGAGYISVPTAYAQRSWRPGDYLPNWFWRYQVRDYWSYGLPQPPFGCAWVWVNNDVALIDTTDGYILDIDYNIW